MTPVDGLVSPAYVVAKPRLGTEPRYFSFLFRTSAYMVEVDKYSRGIVKDRNRLYWDDFKQMPTPYPPPDEQVLIADAIDQSMAAIDNRIHRIKQQISLLREYRTGLIADVVTGKLDVREASAAPARGRFTRVRGGSGRHVGCRHPVGPERSRRGSRRGRGMTTDTFPNAASKAWCATAPAGAAARPATTRPRWQRRR